ncbi:MAG: MFS transporter [Clostridia bacterium]
MENETANIIKPNTKIRFGEKTAFACGEIYGSGAVALLSVLYLTFLTQILHIPPAIAGTIIMLAKIWDAVTDPLMGVISDNTRTKFGRRRPYIFASGFLLIVGLMLLFMPIQSWQSMPLKVTYVIIAYMIYSTISTVFNVPYLSLTSEISQNVTERSNMNFARTAIGMVASGICYLVPTELLGLQRDGVVSDTQFCFIIVICFGIFFAVPVFLTAIFSKERAPLPAQKAHFTFKNFTKTFELKAFRRLLVMYMFSFVCNEIIASLLITFVFNVSGGIKVAVFGATMSLATLVNMSMLLCAGVVLPVALILLNKKVPKPVIFMIGLPFYMIGALLLAFFPTSWNPNYMILCSAIAGIGFGMVQVIPWLTFPDIIDVAELKSNDRNPGAYNGTMTFFKKFATGVAVFLVGQILAISGYDSTLGTSDFQPTSAVTGMRIAIGVSAVIFLTIAFVAALRIKITTRKSERVRYFIDKQREDNLATLTEEETTELNQLKKELF